MSDTAKSSPSPESGKKRRIDVAAVVALLIGLVFVAVGLVLAISALPAATKHGILVVGHFYPSDVGVGSSAAQNALFFLGFGIMAVGTGLILAEGFTERYTFTYFGVSVGSTLGVAGLMFAGWKTIAEPPAFRYATISFLCSNSTPPQGDLRLHVRPELTLDQAKDMDAGLLELDHQQFRTTASAIADLKSSDSASYSKIRKDARDYYLPMVPGAGNKLLLPTLLDVQNEVLAEYKAPERIMSAEDAVTAPLPRNGRDLQSNGSDYHTVMRLFVRPKAAPGGGHFSLEWEPEILEATIFLDEIGRVCPEQGNSTLNSASNN